MGKNPVCAYKGKESVDKFFKLVNKILDYDRQIKYAFSDMEYDPVVATKNQFTSIHKNLVNELDEYFTKGVFKDDIYEKADAIVDMCIYTLNTLPDLFVKNGPVDIFHSISERDDLVLSLRANGLQIQGKEHNSVPEHHVAKEPLEILYRYAIDPKTSKPAVNIYASVYYYLLWLNTNGYNPFGCLLECLKEVTSRKSKWSDEQGKFVKLPGYYSKLEYNMFIMHNFPNIGEVETIEENGFYYTLDKQTKAVLAKGVKWYKADYNKYYKSRSKLPTKAILKELKELEEVLYNTLKNI